MEKINSNVENNKDLVKVGTRISYSDAVNFMTYIVTDVDNESFECINKETKEEEFYFFKELQHGWDFL